MNTNQIRLDPAFPVAGAGNCPEIAGGWRTWVGRALEALRRHRQRSRAIGELARMSDWRLADLGIPREQIPEVVDGLIARQGPALRCAAK